MLHNDSCITGLLYPYVNTMIIYSYLRVHIILFLIHKLFLYLKLYFIWIQFLYIYSHHVSYINWYNLLIRDKA